MAYAAIEPFGTALEDQRTGMICACILNAVLMANYDPKKEKPKWFEPDDFIPNYFAEEKGKKHQTIDEMKKIMQAIAGKR